MLSIGAATNLFLIGLLIIMNALMIALALSIIGLLIGVYGIYLIGLAQGLLHVLFNHRRYSIIDYPIINSQSVIA